MEMEAFAPWLTPALLVGLVAWLRSELIGRTDKLDKRFDAVDKRFDAVDKRFDAVDKRFDGVTREIADLRERMARSLRRRTVQTPSRVGWAPSGAEGDDGRARLEGALEGFLAGRRDRDAA